eukprot:1158208-Pelagomonas_calceolata.AAC.23
MKASKYEGVKASRRQSIKASKYQGVKVSRRQQSNRAQNQRSHEHDTITSWSRHPCRWCRGMGKEELAKWCRGQPSRLS